MFKRLIAIVALLAFCAIPSTALAGAACFCYFGEKNDCQKITVDQNATQQQCESGCKTQYLDAYQKSDFSDSVLFSTKSEVLCKAAHETATTEEAKPYTQGVLPKLNVDIPTVTFSPILEKGGNLEISFLAEYIHGVYKYLIGISVTLAVVFLMVGGLQWSLGGASSAQISKAKERIKNALSGLVLLLSVVLILEIVNPQLIASNPIIIEKVEEITIPLVTEVIDQLGESSTTPGEGMSSVETAPGDHKNAVGPNTTLTDADIKAAANNNGIDECFLWSFAKKESGGKLHAIGHDENYPKNNKPVAARKDLLMSGKKYSGGSFAPPTSGAFDWKTMNNYNVYNDDKFQPNNPPHYGLDWRFSHGIGYIQLTIFPTKNNSMGKLIEGPNGPEWARKVRGKWFTVTDLLNADTALEASIRFFGSTCGKKPTVVEAMKCGKVSNAAMGRALAAYQKCPLKKTMSISAEDLKLYPPKGSH